MGEVMTDEEHRAWMQGAELEHGDRHDVIWELLAIAREVAS